MQLNCTQIVNTESIKEKFETQYTSLLYSAHTAAVFIVLSIFVFLDTLSACLDPIFHFRVLLHNFLFGRYLRHLLTTVPVIYRPAFVGN